MCNLLYTHGSINSHCQHQCHNEREKNEKTQDGYVKFETNVFFFSKNYSFASHSPSLSSKAFYINKKWIFFKPNVVTAGVVNYFFNFCFRKEKERGEFKATYTNYSVCLFSDQGLFIIY